MIADTVAFYLGQASRAVKLVGTEVLRAVDGNQVPVSKNPIGLQVLSPLQWPEKPGKDGFQILGLDRIKQSPQLAVLGDTRDGEHRMQVAFLTCLLKPALEGTQGRILEEHHSKAAHQTVVQGKAKLSRLSGIGDLSELVRQDVSQSREAQMLFDVHAPSAMSDVVTC